MGLTLRWVPHVVSLLLSLCFWLFVSAGALKIFNQDTPEFTCSKGLTDCHVDQAPFSDVFPDPYSKVDVTQLQLESVLCCSNRQNCSLCLQVTITLQDMMMIQAEEVGDVMDVSEESGDDSEKEAFVKVHFSIPGTLERWKVLYFKQRNSTVDKSTYKPEEENQVVISSDFVAPCLCFQAWWKGSLKTQICPFKNNEDALKNMQHNVSATLVESHFWDGGTRLIWNVSAPCILEAEVWLCKKDQVGGQCEEVMGSRQRLEAEWDERSNRYLQTGEFNVSSHPLLCVQMKINGTNSPLELQCPFATSRLRWSLVLIIGLLFMCLAILGAYLIQGILQGYVWKWLKDEDVKGAVGGVHVVLLYPPDDNPCLPELLCHLGSSLQTLGFTVSLDLWSHTELSMLGPVPWLHSRLDQLQRQGGKVVLVLTQASWTKAEEWGAQRSERKRHVEEEEAGRDYPGSSRCADVFSASLSCVLADYLQGRAGERFMLVQFESFPPEPPGSFRPLPELFRGLHVYSLPSQSLGFLTELAGARQVATASARRKRAGGLRMASRALAQRLSAFTAGSNVLRLVGVHQSCVAVGVEDSGETVPLQPSLITPPSSPDMDLQASEMEWA
ncbi:interleukin-17 receptor C isoform X3 [Oreochromis niloticus]|uniref:interleukin-17 receptor C isoform X3 n=1 Tax=Oreochromis niloticus TaxID=8128 RepID=UPI0009059BDB|nr:interleukin-17 receptor C isoform X3 [Oreochromis niloticus]